MKRRSTIISMVNSYAPKKRIICSPETDQKAGCSACKHHLPGNIITRFMWITTVENHHPLTIHSQCSPWNSGILTVFSIRRNRQAALSTVRAWVVGVIKHHGWWSCASQPFTDGQVLASWWTIQSLFNEFLDGSLCWLIYDPLMIAWLMVSQWGNLWFIGGQQWLVDCELNEKSMSSLS